MNCRECADFLSDYMSGELPLAEREAFDRHLARCPNCVAYLDQLQAAVRAGKRACADLEAEIPEELIRAILKARRAGS